MLHLGLVLLCALARFTFAIECPLNGIQDGVQLKPGQCAASYVCVGENGTVLVYNAKDRRKVQCKSTYFTLRCASGRNSVTLAESNTKCDYAIIDFDSAGVVRQTCCHNKQSPKEECIPKPKPDPSDNCGPQSSGTATPCSSSSCDPKLSGTSTPPPKSSSTATSRPKSSGTTTSCSSNSCGPRSSGTTTPHPKSSGTTTPRPKSSGTTTPRPKSSGTTTPRPKSSGTTTPGPKSSSITTPHPKSSGTTGPGTGSCKLNPNIPCPGIYVLQSVATKTVIGLGNVSKKTGRTRVVGGPNTKVAKQRWQLSYAGNNEYFLINVASGTYMSGRSNSQAITGNRASPVDRFSKWKIEPALTKGAYIFYNVGDPKRALDLSKAGTKNGTPLILYPKHGGKNQQWILNKP